VSKLHFCILTAVLCVTPIFPQSKSGSEITPEKIVAEHIKSITVLSSIKSLTLVGTTKADFFQGGYGSMTGNSMVVSDGNKIGIVMKFTDINYPGEYFAFDGKDVSVGYISPGQRSPAGDFIFHYNGLVKEGLLGGIFSGGWPLLDLQNRKVDLKSEETTIAGHKLYEIEYKPKQALRDMKIRLYFDPETYRHVRTEYRVRVKDDLSFGTMSEGGFLGSATQPESIYVLIEKFEDFKKVGVIDLPHTYTIDYSVEGSGHAFVGKWTLKALQWAFNRTLDERLFKAQK